MFKRRFTQARLKSMRKLGLFDIERGKICEKINEAGIWYLPLKGDCYKGLLPRSLDGKDTKGAKTKYLLDRTFISGKALEKQYPFFARHKLLLPALYIYRPVKGIIKRPKYILREVKKVIKYKSPKNRL